jgi:hypothetical protein
VVARGVVLLEEWQRARGTAASRSGLLVVDFIFCWIEHLLGFVKFNVDVSFFFLAIVVWLVSRFLSMTKTTYLSHGECKGRGFVGLDLLYTGGSTIFK